MNATIKAGKDALRRHMKGVLSGLSEAEKARQSRAVAATLLASPVYARASRVAVFLSMADEVNTAPIVEHCLGAGKQCFVPRYDSKSRFMDMVKMHSLADFQNLPETSWKIKQPPLGEQREDALRTGGLDLVLVPGLAFTARGERLGRGRGYYDTFLTSCLAVCTPDTVALAFTQQIVEEVPTEPTDVRIGMIITA